VASIRQALLGSSRSKNENPMRILVPIAGDDRDDRLISYANKIAQKKYSYISLIYVVEVDQALPLDADLPGDMNHGENVLSRAQDAICVGLDPKTCAVKADLLQARLAGPAIVDEAVSQNSDAIIMSARVTKKLGKRTVGDTVDYVLKNAPCEVIILRAPMSETLVHELEMDIE
jgi:nucleotide-binding universal stress UspA family protein